MLVRIGDREHDEPILVAGDFNATKTAALIRAMTSVGPGQINLPDLAKPPR